MRLRITAASTCTSPTASGLVGGQIIELAVFNPVLVVLAASQEFRDRLDHVADVEVHLHSPGFRGAPAAAAHASINKRTTRGHGRRMAASFHRVRNAGRYVFVHGIGK